MLATNLIPVIVIDCYIRIAEIQHPSCSKFSGLLKPFKLFNLTNNKNLKDIYINYMTETWFTDQCIPYANPSTAFIHSSFIL